MDLNWLRLGRQMNHLMAYSYTYLTHPELWTKDPSFMAKVEYGDGQQSVIASGWHRRQIEFENPSVIFEDNEEGIAIHPAGGEVAIQNNTWNDITKFEIEMSLDGINDDANALILTHFITEQSARVFVDSVQELLTRTSANRANSQINDKSFGVLYPIDLLCQNMPARSGNTEEPLRTLYRWCRIFEVPSGTITIYKEIDTDQLANLRWPHNGIWLNRGEKYFHNKTEIGLISTAVNIPVQYEEYNLQNWRIEFEFWENQPFQVMVSDDSKQAAIRLGIAQKEIGVLSSYLTMAYLSARNLEHRSKTNKTALDNPAIQKYLSSKSSEIITKVEEYRSLLGHASALLANTAQSVQAIASQENAAASERTNTFLTYASAIFSFHH